MLIKVSFTILAFIVSTSVLAAGAQQSRDPKFESFKSEMMPQVGKKITVAGILRSGKLGWLVAFKEWGVYMYVVAGPDEGAAMRKMNDLNRLEGHTVQVTATLRYFPPPPPPAKSESIVAIPPEHFYFDVLEARVVSLSAPRLKRSKGRREKKSSTISTPPAKAFKRNAARLAFLSCLS